MHYTKWTKIILYYLHDSLTIEGDQSTVI
uniref:Uncharacterized protein n=1 Tax=Arundo donax TaxID=35708 RepID=A0A0A9B3I3_ARUDO